jgi:hypothetical protein
MSLLDIFKGKKGGKTQEPPAEPSKSRRKKHRGGRGKNSSSKKWLGRAQKLSGQIGTTDRAGAVYTNVFVTRKIRGYVFIHNHVLITQVYRSDPSIAGNLKWRIEWLPVEPDLSFNTGKSMQPLSLIGLMTDA